MTGCNTVDFFHGFEQGWVVFSAELFTKKYALIHKILLAFCVLRCLPATNAMAGKYEKSEIFYEEKKNNVW